MDMIYTFYWKCCCFVPKLKKFNFILPFFSIPSRCCAFSSFWPQGCQARSAQARLKSTWGDVRSDWLRLTSEFPKPLKATCSRILFTVLSPKQNIAYAWRTCAEEFAPLSLWCILAFLTHLSGPLSWAAAGSQWPRGRVSPYSPPLCVQGGLGKHQILSLWFGPPPWGACLLT